MRRWTGWPPGRRPSRTRSRRGTWSAARWCFTMCVFCRVRGADLPAGRDRLPQGRGPRPPADRLRAAHVQGVPVAIEVFEGNTGDPKTVASQVAMIKDRFDLRIGDRSRQQGDTQPGVARQRGLSASVTA
jgi:hypothetical protein